MTTNSVRIKHKVMQHCLAKKPSYMSMTAFVNYSLENHFLGLDACDTLKIPNERERETKKEGGILSNTKKVPNSINKEKENLKKTRFKFSTDLIPFDLEFCF